ncbi:MAG: tripartite tricarboxylate transporter substrate-binding protein [Comamonadaceae bacterium]|nr:tripartite tricarboxylate transporter substrate-binding protein [Comamonadaceae bacterium]
MAAPLTRRRCLAALSLALTAPAALRQAAWAQASAALPAPVRLLVGFPSGGGTDLLARLLAVHLGQALQREVLVDNLPGSGGQRAALALKAALADGQTLLLSHAHTINILPMTTAEPGFDPQQDFTPVAGLVDFVDALAVPASHPARNWAEYHQWLQAQTLPQQRVVGVPAAGSIPAFLVQCLQRNHGLPLQAVPYRGSAPMLAELLQGRIQAVVAAMHELLELHRAQRIRVLAVLGAQRQAALPEVPTFAELGLAGFEQASFYGLYAPRDLPPATLAQWEQAVQQVLARPDVAQQLNDWGMSVQFMNRQQLQAREAAHRMAWKRLIVCAEPKAAGQGCRDC